MGESSFISKTFTSFYLVIAILGSHSTRSNELVASSRFLVWILGVAAHLIPPSIQLCRMALRRYDRNDATKPQATRHAQAVDRLARENGPFYVESLRESGDRPDSPATVGGPGEPHETSQW